MILIQSSSGRNPLFGFRVDRNLIQYIGTNLQRPECILAERDGTLWSADARGGVVRIAPDGTQHLITQKLDPHFDLAASAADSLLSGTLPNGLAFAENGDILIANFGTDRLERMTRSGEVRVILDEIEGRPLGKVNFVLRDRQNRTWVSVSTKTNPWSMAINSTIADGSIILIDDKGPRIVADGFRFANEMRLDAREEWLYVAETTGKRITRLRVQSNGSLADREIYGPADLGPGVVDGMAFDAYGNLWATMIFADRLIAITPEGDVLNLLEDGDPAATARFEAVFATGNPAAFDILMACGGPLCTWLASVTFGGPDLSTVYLGGLRATTIPYFRSPVSGLPMAHWGG
jgi:gluconolactonase